MKNQLENNESYLGFTDNKTAFTEIGTLEDISMVVTDAKPDEVWLQAFKEYGIECIYPE